MGGKRGEGWDQLGYIFMLCDRQETLPLPLPLAAATAAAGDNSDEKARQSVAEDLSLAV